MKRLIAAAIIFAAIVLTGIGGILTIKSTGADVEKRITQIQNTALTDTDKRAEEFFYFWEDKRELMAVFVNHEAIDEIGRLAAKMVSAERSGDKAVLFESANEILFIIRGIEEDESFSLYTML
ncbi:MAG: DUF4363 family protein [Clostridia bacterium]|nr:DUF4363 family protein [Clostridia bacterium]